MAGTKSGGKKASETNKKRHGSDFYKRIGSVGGTKSNNGGFASNIPDSEGRTGPERAIVVGAIGGANSKRGKAKKNKDVQA